MADIKSMRCVCIFCATFAHNGICVKIPVNWFVMRLWWLFLIFLFASWFQTVLPIAKFTYCVWNELSIDFFPMFSFYKMLQTFHLVRRSNAGIEMRDQWHARHLNDHWSKMKIEFSISYLLLMPSYCSAVASYLAGLLYENLNCLLPCELVKTIKIPNITLKPITLMCNHHILSLTHNYTKTQTE